MLSTAAQSPQRSARLARFRRFPGAPASGLALRRGLTSRHTAQLHSRYYHRFPKRIMIDISGLRADKTAPFSSLISRTCTTFFGPALRMDITNMVVASNARFRTHQGRRVSSTKPKEDEHIHIYKKTRSTIMATSLSSPLYRRRKGLPRYMSGQYPIRAEWTPLLVRVHVVLA